MARQFNEVSNPVRNKTTPEKRKRHRLHYEAAKAEFEELQRNGHPNIRPQLRSLPDDLRGLECGAATRAGTPCKQKAIYDNARCKWHGGLSTGPKTEAGKRAAAANGKFGGRGKKRLVDESALSGQLDTEVNGGHGIQMVTKETGLQDVIVSPLVSQKTVTATNCRCNECAKLSAAWTCLAASRGELGVDAPVRPELWADRICTAFIPQF